MEKAKNKEKVAASKKATNVMQYRLKQKRKVESVEEGDKSYKALSNNAINLKLDRAHENLPVTDEEGEYMIIYSE